jgi:putative dimethyl sulfoxide reductase chaperone
MSETDQSMSNLAGLAQTRAAFSSFLNIHFTALPDEKFVEQIRHEDVVSMLKILPKDESVNEDIATGASLMEKFLYETQEDSLTRLSEKLGVDRTRLYRGLSPEYGPPPPYEMVWSQKWQEVSLLQVLATLYRKNGLTPSSEVIDRQDYIGVELEFIHALAMREVAAWEAGDEEKAKSLLTIQKEFFLEHLSPWVPFFIEKAFEFVKTDFYQGHLLMLKGFILDQANVFSTL